MPTDGLGPAQGPYHGRSPTSEPDASASGVLQTRPAGAGDYAAMGIEARMVVPWLVDCTCMSPP
jgi:hypothetical protein